MFTDFLLPTIVFLLAKKYAETGAIYCTYRKNEKMLCSSPDTYFCVCIFACTLKNRFFISNQHFVNLHKIKIKNG